MIYLISKILSLILKKNYLYLSKILSLEKKRLIKNLAKQTQQKGYI